ncbi:hypothetical protein HanRHA438_Chr01g0012771 [Helianthus annuus]|nr:hypothetical protein HanRHA438_Chr01g0012771 [Helianthus annuus]
MVWLIVGLVRIGLIWFTIKWVGLFKLGNWAEDMLCSWAIIGGKKAETRNCKRKDLRAKKYFTSIMHFS